MRAPAGKDHTSYREHFSADLEYQVGAPLDLFRGARIGEAMLAELFESHRATLPEGPGHSIELKDVHR